MTDLGKSGGVYIPPFRLRSMMPEVEDKSSLEYQKMTWDALKKSINGLVNKVNAANIKDIIPELFSENLVRGRALFAQSCIKSQMASPAFTDVFAALVAVVNTKFPQVGELQLRMIILRLRRAYKRNDKFLITSILFVFLQHQLLAAVKFITHLVNQQVAHELIALELLTLLLEIQLKTELRLLLLLLLNAVRYSRIYLLKACMVSCCFFYPYLLTTSNCYLYIN
ncbi:putative MIF4G-like domain superfamily protein [Helianthus anomalus]